MRRMTLIVSFLIAMPLALSAAEPGPAQPEAVKTTAPAVHVERTTQVQAPTVQKEVRANHARVMQEEGPSSRHWWYLVGAIVAAGIILAIVL